MATSEQGPDCAGADSNPLALPCRGLGGSLPRHMGGGASLTTEPSCLPEAPPAPCAAARGQKVESMGNGFLSSHTPSGVRPVRDGRGCAPGPLGEQASRALGGIW